MRWPRGRYNGSRIVGFIFAETTMKNDAIQRLATQIAHEIMTDGMGKTAKRIALDYSGTGGGTGRCTISVVDAVDQVLRESPLLRRPK